MISCEISMNAVCSSIGFMPRIDWGAKLHCSVLIN